MTCSIQSPVTTGQAINHSQQHFINIEQGSPKGVKTDIKEEIDTISLARPLDFETLVKMGDTNIDEICHDMMAAAQTTDTSLQGNKAEMNDFLETEMCVDVVSKNDAQRKRQHSQTSLHENPPKKEECPEIEKSINAVPVPKKQLPQSIRRKRNSSPGSIEITGTETDQGVKLKKSKKNKIYECNKCPNVVKFSKRCDLVQHLFKEHNERDENSSFCEVCELVFVTLTAFERHKEKKHGLTSESLKLKCNRCPTSDLTFRRPGDLRRHLFKVHNERNRNTLVCEKCRMVFSQLTAFEIHKQKHESGFRCQICKESFPDVKTQKRHVRECKQKLKVENSINCKKTSAICTKCGVNFSSTKSLIRHLYIIHKEQYPSTFACDKCRRIFTSVKGLERHKLRHKSASGFSCNYCNMTFPDARALRNHISCKHGIRYCRHCSAEFKSSLEKDVSHDFNYPRKTQR